MRIDEYVRYDGLGLAGLIDQGEVSAMEVVEVAIRHVEAVDSRLNAVVDRYFDGARRAVADGLPAGPFRGVPFLLKDMLEWEGTTNTYGSAFLMDNPSHSTHPLVRRYLDAGFVILGKTNMSELGLLPLTEPHAFGPTHNPWHHEYSTGGSSGGSAAAVAARMVPIAHGADGGGSIRIPASACGVFGLKPTRGRTPSAVDVEPEGLVVDHALSVSVRDSAALLDVSRGNSPTDRFLPPPEGGSYLEASRTPPGPLRIAFSVEDFRGVPVHPECRAMVLATADLLESLGHHVEERRPPLDGEAFNEAFAHIWAMYAGYLFKAVRREIGTLSMPGPLRRLLQSPLGVDLVTHARTLPRGKLPFEPVTRILAGMDRANSPSDLWIAWDTLRREAAKLTGFFEASDLLLTPVLSEPTWRLGAFSQRQSFESMRQQLFGYIGFTPIANTTGMPGMSVPLFRDKSGLPMGSHFIAPLGHEARLFSLAGQLEQVRPWNDTLPSGLV